MEVFGFILPKVAVLTFYTAQGGSTDIALYSLVRRGGVLEYEYTTVDSYRGISAG